MQLFGESFVFLLLSSSSYYGLELLHVAPLLYPPRGILEYSISNSTQCTPCGDQCLNCQNMTTTHTTVQMFWDVHALFALMGCGWGVWVGIIAGYKTIRKKW